MPDLFSIFNLKENKELYDLGKAVSAGMIGVVIFLVADAAAQLILAGVIRLMAAQNGTEPDMELVMTLASCMQYFVALPAAFIYFRLFPAVKKPYDDGLLEPVGFVVFFCMCMLLMYAGNFVGNTVMYFADPQAENEVSEYLLESGPLSTFIFTVIAAPIAEEFIFRKMLIDHLLSAGEGTAVIISAVIFGAAHGNLFQFFYAFLIGLIFAYIYIRTGNIFNTVILHVLINLVGGLLPLLIYTIDNDVIAETTYEAYAFIVLSFCVGGLVCLIRYGAHFRLRGRELKEMWSGEWLRGVLLNPGMLIFLVWTVFSELILYS